MLLAAFFVLPQTYKERLTMLDNLSKARNQKIKFQLRLNYSLIFLSIGLIIFLLIRSVILNPPVVTANPGNIYTPGLNGNGSAGFADYGYFILPLIILLVFKKLIDARARYR